MTINRRELLGGKTAKAGPRDVLVCIFQRGAADGLNAVVPYADADYYRHRPNIAVPPPGSNGGALILDGLFGLHPALEPLLPWFGGGQLALVHACGMPHGIRSHFQAQSLTEAGVTAAAEQSGSGWLGRYLAATAAAEDRPLRAVAVSGAVPPMLHGATDPLAIDNIGTFGLGELGGTAYQDTLALLYAPPAPFASVAGAAFGAIDELAAADPGSIPIDNGASYPDGALASRMQQAAQLIKADLGVEVVCIDSQDWDHHENLPNFIAGSLAQLGGTLSAFATDLGAHLARVSVVVMTEFGRRVAENGSRGTDHGTAGCLYLLGGGVLGGQVVAQWPGLADEALALGEDLAITTDLRGVLVQLLQRRMGYADAASLFPGFAGATAPELFATAA